jgi:hypothetical protein
MTTTDLKTTIERLRAQKYPDLDSSLVNDLISSQANFMDNNSEAYKRILQCVEVYLQKDGEDKNA